MPFKVSIEPKERGIVSQFTLQDHEAAHLAGLLSADMKDGKAVAESAIMRVTVERCGLSEPAKKTNAQPVSEIPFSRC